MAMINIIVAVNKKGYIGKDNKLMWHNTEDLQLFKNITKDGIVVMGRKTWDSLPTKPLPNRENIVLTRNKEFNIDDFRDGKTYWIIGGEEIYNLFLPYTDNVYVSKIDNDDIGDKSFDLTYVKENFEKKVIRYAKTFKQNIYARV